MDIEQKLDFIQQIHREQAENERYIYDNLRRRNYKRESISQRQNVQVTWLASFRFRLLVSMLLFLCFFVMDKKEIVYGGINSSKIMNHIESNIKIEELLAYLKIETDNK